TEIALPLLVAPTAFQRLCHADGEIAMARAAASAGTVMTQSTLSSVTPAELEAGAPGGPKWFQLYWSPDRGFTQELVQEAAGAGFTALVLTVDLPVPGPRERDARAGYALPDDLPLPNIPAGNPAGGLPLRPWRRRRRHDHLARPGVAALGVPATARGQGDSDQRGRTARRRARRGCRRRLEPRRTAARRRARLARRAARGGRDRGRARRGARRRRHPPRHRRAEGARTGCEGCAHRACRAVGPRGRGRGRRRARARAPAPGARVGAEAARLHLTGRGDAGPRAAGVHIV